MYNFSFLPMSQINRPRPWYIDIIIPHLPQKSIAFYHISYLLASLAGGSRSSCVWHDPGVQKQPGRVPAHPKCVTVCLRTRRSWAGAESRGPVLDWRDTAPSEAATLTQQQGAQLAPLLPGPLCRRPTAREAQDIEIEPQQKKSQVADTEVYFDDNDNDTTTINNNG